MQKTRLGNTIIAFELFLTGSLLIYAYWIKRPLDFARSWPLVLIFLGLPMLAQQFAAAKTNKQGLFLIGFSLLSFGAFFMIFSMSIWNLSWIDLRIYWPFCLILPGISLALIHRYDSLHYRGANALANILLLIGFIALGITYSIYRTRASLAFLNHWPLLLLPAVFYLIGLFKPVDQVGEDG